MINEHPIDNLMKNTMESLKSMVDVNTVIGDALTTNDGGIILPISKVTLGFASGGTEFADNLTEKALSSYPFGGGSGAGMSVKPVGFLYVRNGSIRYIPVEENSTYDKIIDTIPQLMDIIKDFFNKSNSNSYDDDSCSCECHCDES